MTGPCRLENYGANYTRRRFEGARTLFIPFGKTTGNVFLHTPSPAMAGAENSRGASERAIARPTISETPVGATWNDGYGTLENAYILIET